MKKYAVGFAFNEAGDEVVLIKKNRPQWQAGKLNGVGGHVEKGETFADCMVREFKEETGVQTFTPNWQQIARIHSPQFELHVFAAFTSRIYDVKTTTDEEVNIYRASSVLSLDVISNLRWLIPAALDKHFMDNGYTLEAKYVA